MPQGNWTCSGCGGAITELPFEPRSSANLKCKECFKKGAGGSSAPAVGGERKMFEGNWQCSGCSAPINKLPFAPRETGNLLCVDCFKKR